jgi:hypothetical protein
LTKDETTRGGINSAALFFSRITTGERKIGFLLIEIFEREFNLSENRHLGRGGLFL